MDRHSNEHKPSSETQPAFSERRRFVRLTVTNEQFRLAVNSKVYSVSDLSENGIGLWLSTPQDHQCFSVGRSISGTLNLKGRKFQLEACVRNLGDDRVGAEFEQVDPDLPKALKDYLSPEHIGSSLKPVPTNEYKTVQYFGPFATDFLVYREIDGQWDRFSLRFFDSFVKWDASDGGLVTGTVRPTKDRSLFNGVLREELVYLDRDAELDHSKLRIAKLILVSSKLPLDLVSWCLLKIAC